MTDTRATRRPESDGAGEKAARLASHCLERLASIFRRSQHCLWPRKGSPMLDSTNPADLVYRISQMPTDEQTIIKALVDRLDTGRQSYGPWHIDDGRQYEAEAMEEVLDALHYVAAQLVRITRRSQTNGQEVGQ